MSKTTSNSFATSKRTGIQSASLSVDPNADQTTSDIDYLEAAPESPVRTTDTKTGSKTHEESPETRQASPDAEADGADVKSLLSTDESSENPFQGTSYTIIETSDPEVARPTVTSSPATEKTVVQETDGTLGKLGSGGTTKEETEGGFKVVGNPAAGAPVSIDDDNLDDLFEHMLNEDRVWDFNDTEWGEDVVVLTYAFPQSADLVPLHWQQADGWADEDGEFMPISAWILFDPFGAEQINGALAAMQQWEDIANVRFEPATGQFADIYFYGHNSPDASWGATSNASFYEDELFDNRIRYNSSLDSWDNMSLGSRALNTMMHEVGHTLGLGHPGHYDSGDGATYDDDVEFIQDTDMYTIMSYFDGENTGADYAGFNNFQDTPRTYDMYVIQDVYGANWNTRMFETTYGYNANGVGDVFDFTVNGSPILTIWDGGGVDTLDLSGDDSGVTLDLNPGAFSSTHGMTYNISIAYVPDGAPSGHEAYIENAVGGDGDDTLIGNVRHNDLFGGDGDDDLFGGDGADQLFGGMGDDRLTGGFGTDYFDGGWGDDTVDFTYSTGNWNIHLSSVSNTWGAGGVEGTATAGGGVETLVDIENVDMGDGDDTVRGSWRDNILRGGGGEDRLYGFGGDDNLFGGSGNNFLYGGSGNDDLYGSNDGADFLYGGADDDNLFGGFEADYLFGGSGDDDLIGGGGDDVLNGGFGTDRLFGGGGTDTANYTYSSEDWSISLQNEYAWAESGAIETIRSIEIVQMGSGNDTVGGSAKNEFLYGGAGDDKLLGHGGADFLYGGSQNDELQGGAGNDVMFGGDGWDMVNYQADDAAVRVDLGITGMQDTVGSGVDMIQEVENLIGSNYNDWLFGNHDANWILGDEGNDNIFGRGGDDFLFGGQDDDIILGGLGNDYIDGGLGEDMASYALASEGVIVSLAAEGVQNTFGDGDDVLINIENLGGSLFADWLTGDDNGNRIEGYMGDDLISGGDGGDRLFGGQGNDTLNGGLGNDVIDGGDGDDWAYYNSAGLTEGVMVDLQLETQNTGGAGVDTILNVENISGSIHDDILAGDAGSNEIYGAGGTDWIFGRAGNDLLRGGHGDDFIFGETGHDDIDGGYGNDVLVGGAGFDDFIFTGNWGDDWIGDFDVAQDDLDFTNVNGLDNLIQLDISDTADGAMIAYGSNSVLLAGVSVANLSDDNFII